MRTNAKPTQKVHATQAWVTVGTMRLTAGAWDLLCCLIATPTLQSASNGDLERTRSGRQFSSVATDLEELINKGLVMVHGSTKGGRTIQPTTTALDAVAGR